LAVLTGRQFQTFEGVNLRPSIYNAPDLSTIFGVSSNPAVEAGNAPQTNGTYLTQRFKNGRAFNSIQQLGILDLICEGPIEGFVSGIYIPSFSGKTNGDIGYSDVKFNPFANSQTNSIYWDDVPITDLQGLYNFQYVNYKYTYGEKTNDHTIYNPYINLYEDRSDYFGRKTDINKIPLETSITKVYGETLYGLYSRDEIDTRLQPLTEYYSNPSSVATPKTCYVYNTDVSSIKVSIKINSLYQSTLSGDFAGNVNKQQLSINFGIYRILNNGDLVELDTSKYPPYIKDYYSDDNIGIIGKVQNTPVVITYEIVLRPFSENSPYFRLLPNQIGWAIDITKLQRESTNPGIGTFTTLDSITEVYSDRFVYPDTAMVFSKFDARYFSSIPSRTYKLRLLKVKIPVNYDPIKKTYDGPWNGQFKVAWTDNPAWCFYDLITSNRFGLGKYINANLTDKWTLYEIAQYCDQLVPDGTGGLEPRFTCNLYIGNKEEAYKVISDMASIFRAIVYYSAGQIFTAQDSPKDPIYIFNNSNVIKKTREKINIFPNKFKIIF
jgi:predicted phage tail protein